MSSAGNDTIFMVTGHRPAGIGGTYQRHQWVRTQLRDILAKMKEMHGGNLVALMGMARGADTWFGLEAVKLGIRLHIDIPFEGHGDKLGGSDREAYDKLVDYAEHVEVLAGVPASYGEMVLRFRARNQRMVDRAHYAVAVWSGTPRGGTAHAVRLLREKGTITLHVHPGMRTVTMLSGVSTPAT